MKQQTRSRVRIIVEVDQGDAAAIASLQQTAPYPTTRSEIVRALLRRGIAATLGSGGPPAVRISS